MLKFTRKERNILLFPIFFLIALAIVAGLHQRDALSQYDYVLGQKISIDDIEPPDNYELEVYLEEEEAISTIFKGCDEILTSHLALNKEEKEAIENRLKARFDENAFTIFIGKRQGKIQRYAIITDEMGCFHPITFILSTDRNGKVEQVAVMVYRESRGKEVVRNRFLYQYKGKTLNDPIRVNKDIINVTGATTSVRGVNRGVRKMLTVLNDFRLHSNRETTLVPYNQTMDQISKEEAKNIYSQAYPAFGDIVGALVTGATENNALLALKEAFKEVYLLNKILNKESKDNELSKINRKAWKKPVKCESELFNLIKSSLYYSEITDGGFDITEGTLIDRLRKTTKKTLKPENIADILKASTYKNIIIEKDRDSKGTIFLKNKKTNIDLALLVKGYVVDRVIEILQDNGISNALVNFGGNVRVIGNPPGRPVWTVAIPDPKRYKKSIGFVRISNKAVAVSGDYERMLIKNRKEFQIHSDSGLQRVFDDNLIETVVIATTAFKADALAAAAHLSGLNKDMGLINRIEDTEGIDFYERPEGGLEIEQSKGIKAYFVQKVSEITLKRMRQACAF